LLICYSLLHQTAISKRLHKSRAFVEFGVTWAL
jgi:hypothetical protein